MAKNKYPTEPTIIKKYSNRRLYDTSRSEYVTLEDLCQIVKDGEDFKVIDAKSGDDLTRSVLTQIIFEQESKGYNLLPIGFLRHVISFYDDSISPIIPAYLENSMDNFTKNQEEIRQYMDSSLDVFNPIKQFEELRKKNMEIFEQTINMFSPFAKDDQDKK